MNKQEIACEKKFLKYALSLFEGFRQMAAAFLACSGAFAGIYVLIMGVLGMDWPIWYKEPLKQIYQYILVPWGFGLGMLCLVRRSEEKARMRWDFSILTVLLLWIVIPFGIRFGFTFNNVSSWYNAFAVYAGIYMLTASGSKAQQKLSHDIMCVIMLLISLVWGGLLLFCAMSATYIDLGGGGYGFGVHFKEYGILYSGMHYNTTAMIAICCCFMDMSGFARSRRKPVKAIYALGAAIMIIVIILTQSRTARYALLLAAAFGVFSWLMVLLKAKKRWIQWIVSLGVAALVLVGGFVGADWFTKAAMESYQNQGVIQTAAAEAEVEIKDEQDNTLVRVAVDAGFSGRTDIWKNVLAYWMENPKLFVIGCGVGRIGSKIVQGTIHESIGSVQLHNTYLQFLADYGLIGFVLLVLFMVMLIRPVWSAFFMRQPGERAGHRALGMMVIACLVTGMMESAPMGPLTPMNTMLFYALGLIHAENGCAEIKGER